MESLKFENTFNSNNGNVGELFQTFVYELLKNSDYPKLHKFQTAGKDGGIDLIQQLNNERTVVECKYVGDGSIEEAKKRWKTVKGHLETQLVTLIPKEKQYKPWLNSEKPIISYLFCVSSEISNQNGFDDFEKEIRDCFKKLAESHSHLNHLRNIKVEILDRSKLLQKLDNFLPLKFKWFALPEKLGFIPIENKSVDASFRSFLEEDSLPFYKRAKHLEKEPNAEIQDEEQLLEMLDNSSLHGLIITGNGGAGKTRLTFELGRLAYKAGWLVYRCTETVDANNLTELAKLIASDAKVLLLMDYVETQKSFRIITEHLQESLNNNADFRIKYVANCRTSYYKEINLTPNHHRVSLTTTDKIDSIWLEQYQTSVVRHILEQGGINIEEKHLIVCKNTPIIAVFLLYLYQKKYSEQLEDLLQEADFGKWIQKRAKMSFVNVADFEIKLAKLAAILPFSKEAEDSFDEFNSNLLNILANDGWIEKFQNSEWRSIHDVFVDRIMLSYIQDNPHFIEKFIRDIFALAYSTSCLDSAFISVQRLSPYLEIDFSKFLNAEIGKETAQWKKIRNNLLETPLLQEEQKLELLSNEDLWENAETDTSFQTSFGTVIRRTVESKAELTELQLSNSKFWLTKTLPFISANNFLLRWALMFLPEDFRDLGLNKIKSSSSDFHTKYIYEAWLDSKLPSGDIGEYLRYWLKKHQDAIEARFVYQSWLDAGGEINFVQDHIEHWLKKYRQHIEAQFICKSWLDAGGEINFVQDHIEHWLKKYRQHIEAGFVYKSWLNAGGEINFVQDHIEHWLEKHQEAIEAQFVYKSWLDAGGKIDLVRDHIECWLKKYRQHIEAQFVYKSWLDAGGKIDLVRDHIECWLEKHQEAIEAQFVYQSWLDAGGDFDLVKEPAIRWLENYQANIVADFTIKAWLNATKEFETVKGYILSWLKVHSENFDADYVMRAWLDAEGDFHHIKIFAAKWLAKHYDKHEAVYLTKKFAKQKDLSPETVRHILEWCNKFSEDEDAIWRLTSLKLRMSDSDIADQILEASEKIIGNLLSKNRLHYNTKGQINTIFFSLFSNAGLKNFESVKRIEKLYLKWLRYPGSFGEKFITFSPCQTPLWVDVFTGMLEKKMLDITIDRLTVERFLRHFNNWHLENKQKIQSKIKESKDKYPSDVWEIVQIVEVE